MSRVTSTKNQCLRKTQLSSYSKSIWEWLLCHLPIVWLIMLGDYVRRMHTRKLLTTTKYENREFELVPFSDDEMKVLLYSARSLIIILPGSWNGTPRLLETQFARFNLEKVETHILSSNGSTIYRNSGKFSQQLHIYPRRTVTVIKPSQLARCLPASGKRRTKQK